MAHVKAGGTSKNLRDSGPKYRGIKLYDGEFAKAGAIIVRQKGAKILAGKNVSMGKDNTLFAIKEGVVKFLEKRKANFDGTSERRKTANVV
ncbi:50S ribosomal protein L27 [Candidatus Parcubacteria bacterium]|nr:MAG: 50S ribosomal protein L27 [Candidatus Parcubacteria bacterium]